MMSRSIRAVATLLIVLPLVGCGTNPPPTQAPPVASASAPTEPVASSTPGSSPVAVVPSASPRLIEQPPVPSDVPVAPDSARVDLTMPTFSNPTQVTNPLFPVSRQQSILMLGHVDNKPFRTEVTTLPYTRIVDWEGQRVETLVSQYFAYLGGRIQEVAYDLYAQADDGSVWYFGEDLGDFEDGAMVTKEGTWLAGKDAPAAMIMAAHPKVGDVFRTENSPGFAFEEVSVKAVDQVLDGPLGPLPGGLLVSELHMDGKTEDKTFGPGYGEFYTADGPDVEALALSAAADAATGSEPAELGTLENGASAIFAAAAAKDWKAASTAVGRMTTAWTKYRAAGVPRLVEPQMTAALDALSRAVAARDTRRSRQAAIDAARLSLDLLLRYRPATAVNLARFDLWAAQVLVDAAAKDPAAIRGDAFTLVYIRDRILRSIDPASLGQINTGLLDLQVAALDGEVAAAAKAATQLRGVVAAIQP